MYEVWVDGSVRDGNPGFGGIGIYAEHDGVEVWRYSSLWGQNVTNNQVEYAAMIDALGYLEDVNTENEDCKIHTDSALVHGQLVKNWKCNFTHLRLLRNDAKHILNSVPFKIEILWSNRLTNEIANELAQAITAEELERRG
uniref:Putative ribonuclease H n=1 Tax=viral metagenome TaxID=1070528 RepID=A0A6M3KVM3_9ZZZZ